MRKGNKKQCSGSIPVKEVSQTATLTIPLLEILLAAASPYLAVSVSLPQASLLRVVEPLDPDYHAGTPGLPQALHPAHVGQLRPARWQEHGTVTDTHRLLASHDGFVEKLAGFTFQTSPLLGWKKNDK